MLNKMGDTINLLNRFIDYDKTNFTLIVNYKKYIYKNYCNINALSDMQKILLMISEKYQFDAGYVDEDKTYKELENEVAKYYNKMLFSAR